MNIASSLAFTLTPAERSCMRIPTRSFFHIICQLVDDYRRKIRLTLASVSAFQFIGMATDGYLILLGEGGYGSVAYGYLIMWGEACEL